MSIKKLCRWLRFAAVTRDGGTGVVKLIYFEGCPNADKVRRNLTEAGIEFSLVRQDDLPTDDPMRRYSSPSILKDDQVMFGAMTDAGGGGCSLDLPSVEEIQRRLGSREMMKAVAGVHNRNHWYRRVLLLSWFTIGYNLIEGAVSVYFGIEEASVSLAAFGVDSFVEVASALVILWRFQGEQGRAAGLAKDREVRALRAIGILFLVLAVGTALGAGAQLLGGKHPDTTLPGLIVALVSLSFMYSLYRAKLTAGKTLNSRSVLSDAACSKACIQLSVVLLAGSLVYVVYPALYWADAVAAIVIAGLIAREGKEILSSADRDDGCCGCG